MRLSVRCTSLRLFWLLGLAPLVLPSPSLRAEIGDVTLTTSHPQYPGEGAFQTPELCAEWATRGATSDHERALALFQWILTHQWHLASPQEWCLPGQTPGAKPDDPEMVVYDANRGRFSYGYGLCGTVHAWNEVYWRALGFEARRRAFPGHTNSEALIDGRWRMVDTDMAGIVLLPDGSLAGYDDITRDLSLLERPQAPWPRYPFAWPSDNETMRRGWEQVAAGGNWYKLYFGGYAAQPGVVHLRSGETFTRYYGPDGFGDAAQRRFWHRQPGGPSRLWTFANGGTPRHDGAESNSRGRVSYGNAVFEYAPDLTSDRCREGMAASSGNLATSPTGLRSKDDQPARVEFEHFSPYVICGNPHDDENPLTNVATDGLVLVGETQGPVRLQVSPDQGQTWSPPQSVSGDFRVDLTEQVKGRYGWQLRFDLEAGSVLKSFQTTTTCQMSQAIYPRLTPNGTEVRFRSTARAVEPVLPGLADALQTEERFEVRDLRSANLSFVGRSPKERVAYRVAGPRPASVVFQVPARTPLTGIAAAARFAVRSPTPPGADYQLDVSTDGGATWKLLGRSTPPDDNEYSSGWVYGAQDFETPSTELVFVRVTLFGGGAGTGLMAAELYGLRQTQTNSDSTVTYEWFEGNTLRQSQFTVPAGTRETTFNVPTGPSVRDHKVTIAVR